MFKMRPPSQRRSRKPESGTSTDEPVRLLPRSLFGKAQALFAQGVRDCMCAEDFSVTKDNNASGLFGFQDQI